MTGKRLEGAVAEPTEVRDRREWANFRKLLVGQSVSQLGIQTTAVVLRCSGCATSRKRPDVRG